MTEHWPVIETDHHHGDTVFLASCTCGWHSGTSRGWNWFPPYNPDPDLIGWIEGPPMLPRALAAYRRLRGRRRIGRIRAAVYAWRIVRATDAEIGRHAR